MVTELDALKALEDTLDGLSDHTVARILFQYGKRHGMPIVAYSTDDIREVLLEMAEDHPNVMLSKFPVIVDAVKQSDAWNDAALHAQEVIEQELYTAVSDSMSKLA